jgi:HNH endonuclease
MTPKDKRRFWSKVKVDRETGCWIWTASVRTWSREPWDGGYGAFSIDGVIHRAHKVAYRILFGRWPSNGKVLLHGCDNRRCVNVLEHVKPGTQIRNVKDMLAKGRAKHQRKNSTINQGEIHGKKERGSVSAGSGSDGPVSIGPVSAGRESGVDRRDPGAAGSAQ